MDAVLYLLDYSKLKTAEEATLLGKLKVPCLMLPDSKDGRGCQDQC